MSLYDTCDKCGKSTPTLRKYQKFDHLKIVNKQQAEAVFEKPVEFCYTCYKAAVKKKIKKHLLFILQILF